MTDDEPALPARMRNLPRDKHDRPVPWFVAWIDGQPDFRIIRSGGIRDALRFSTCWLCGARLGRNVSFVLGPMCAINRTTAEPGSHYDCAVYAAQACPFLATPQMKRREGHMPDSRTPAGVMIARNPGVALVWTSRNWTLFPDGDGGMLIDVGQPDRVDWFAHGRTATREEVLASIDSGLPILRQMAEGDPDPAGAIAELEAQHAAALELVPGAAGRPERAVAAARA